MLPRKLAQKSAETRMVCGAGRICKLMNEVHRLLQDISQQAMAAPAAMTSITGLSSR
jgi:hypothetical protein